MSISALIPPIKKSDVVAVKQHAASSIIHALVTKVEVLVSAYCWIPAFQVGKMVGLLELASFDPSHALERSKQRGAADIGRVDANGAGQDGN